MARKYKRRRNSNQTSVFGDLIAVSALIVLLFTYSTSKEFIDKSKYAFPVLMLIALLLLGLVVYIAWKRRQRLRGVYEAYTLSNVDTMTGIEFETYLADLLRRQGFTNILLTEQYDLGVDIIARKDGVTWGIQAKRYNQLVKAEAVRQVYAALVRYKCDKAMVITNSTFSRPARELAKDNAIELIDRAVLQDWIYESSKVAAEQPI